MRVADFFGACRLWVPELALSKTSSLELVAQPKPGPLKCCA